MGKTSTASKNKWNSEYYDHVNLTMPKGQKDKLKNHAEQQGESLNGFINMAIEEAIERDNQKWGNKALPHFSCAILSPLSP